MNSKYKNDNIFGSGPHRFLVGRQGRRIVPLSAVYGVPAVPGTEQYGEFELRVEVSGRLVASSESNLRGIIDDILAYTALSEEPGTLEDGLGNEWDGVLLLKFETFGSIERGREVSVSYAAEFGVVTGE